MTNKQLMARIAQLEKCLNDLWFKAGVVRFEVKVSPNYKPRSMFVASTK